MTLTIHLGWWCLPLIITAVLLFFGLPFFRDPAEPLWVTTVYWAVAVQISALAWLVWSLFA